jgi:hypothetical protein
VASARAIIRSFSAPLRHRRATAMPVLLRSGPRASTLEAGPLTLSKERCPPKAHPFYRRPKQLFLPLWQLPQLTRLCCGGPWRDYARRRDDTSLRPRRSPARERGLKRLGKPRTGALQCDIVSSGGEASSISGSTWAHLPGLPLTRLSATDVHALYACDREHAHGDRLGRHQ